MENVSTWLLSGAVWMPFFAALLHPPLAWLFQKGDQLRLSMSLTVGVSNLATTLIFLSFLRPDWSADSSWLDLLAVVNGAFFFGGQWFCVKAVKAGDLIVHSSALGTKLIFVGAISVAIGLEAGSLMLLIAVVLSVLGVFFVAGGNLAGWQQHSQTVMWTVIGVLCFAASDVLTSQFAINIGQARWLQLMMLSSACFSVILLIPRHNTLLKACNAWPTLRILLLLSLLMGSQAVLINLAFSYFREPTVSNVVFALRGALAIPFLIIIHRSWKGAATPQKVMGVFLILTALVVAAFA